MKLCEGWHRHGRKPRAKYRIRHRMDSRPMLYCGVHARSFRKSAERGMTAWIIEELESV